jgi:hypothetical protein
MIGSSARWVLATVVFVKATATTAVASAQELRVPPASVAALELTDGVFAGAGVLTRAHGPANLSGAGIAAETSVGSRLDERWGLSAYLAYQELNPDWTRSARGVSAGLAADAHLSPSGRLDPWIRWGAGYRWFWEQEAANGATAVAHGFEVLRVAVGADWRLGSQIALGPSIGGTVDVLSISGAQERTPHGGVGVLGYFGLQARFDVFETEAAAARGRP